MRTRLGGTTISKFMILTGVGVLSALLAGCNQPSVVRLRDRGDYAYDRGDYDAAIAYYEDALELEPEDPRANLALGKAYLAAGEPALARTPLEVAYQHSWTNDERAYETAGYLAEAMAADGDEERLFEFLRERAETTTRVRDYLRWGDYAARFGDADTAELAYRTAMRLTGGMDPDPYLHLATLYEQAGDLEAADRRLRQAYGLAPERTDIADRLRAYHDIVGPSLALPPERPRTDR